MNVFRSSFENVLCELGIIGYNAASRPSGGMADAAVSKTVVERRASSTLASGTIRIWKGRLHSRSFLFQARALLGFIGLVASPLGAFRSCLPRGRFPGKKRRDSAPLPYFELANGGKRRLSADSFPKNAGMPHCGLHNPRSRFSARH